MNQKYRSALSVLLCVLLISTATTIPFVSPTAAQSGTPDPSIVDVDIPSEVKVGETFEVDVEGRNNGGRAGAYSTITISSPDFDGFGDDSRIEVTDDYDFSYSQVSGLGDQIYDADGNELSADYALAEAGTTAGEYWSGGESRSFGAEITPEEPGTIEIYVRVTLTGEDDSTNYNAPTGGPVDQQDFTVKRYEVEVEEDANIEASIDDVDGPSGTLEKGDTATTEVTVDNTGNRDHEFYVGYSVRGPNGEWRDNDGTTHEPIYLRAGREGSVDVEWEIKDGVPAGEYDILTTVYRDESFGELEDKLDEAQRYDVFDVESPNTPPSITAESPGDSRTVAPDETVVFEVDADDADGNLNRVEWNIEDQYISESDQLDGGSDSAGWPTSFDSEGTYTVQAQALDDAGAASDTVEWTITVEGTNTEPSVAAENPYGDTQIAPGESIDFEIDADDQDGNLAGAEWYIDDDHQESTNSIYGDFDTAEWEHTFEEPGTYEVTARVFDEQSAYSDEIAWTVTVEDTNTDPTAEAANPLSDTQIAPGESVDFEIDADDQDGNLAGAEWYINDNFQGSTNSIYGEFDTADWEHTFEDPGTYEVTARVSDGQSAYSDEISWTVTVDEIDTPPQVEILYPYGFEDVKTGDSIEFELSAEDTGGDLAGVAWSIDDETIEETTAIDGGEATSTWEHTFDEPGTYEVEGQAFDENGQYSDSVSWTVEVSKSNAAPTIQVTDPSGKVSTPQGGTVEFYATSSDSDENLAGARWYIDDVLQDETNDISGEAGTAVWSHQFDTPGTYEVSVKVFDSDGGTSDRSTWTVTVTDEKTTDAAVAGFDWPGSEYAAGDDFVRTVEVINTGTKRKAFTVNFEIRPPKGEWREVPSKPGETLSFNPGKTHSREVSVDIPENAEPGEYDGKVIVSAQESDTILDTKVTQSAFEVTPEDDLVTLKEFDPQDAEATPGEEFTVTQSISVEDTERRILKTKYEIKDSDGEWRDIETKELVYDPRSDSTYEQSFVVPGYLTEGSYDLRLSIYGADDQRFLYSQKVVEEAVQIPAEDIIIVRVQDQSGNALESSWVSVSDDTKGPKLAGDDGTVRFENVGTGDMSIKAIPSGDWPVKSKTVTYNGQGEKEIDFVYGEQADVSGTVALSSGDRLRNVEVVIDGHDGETNNDGEFSIREPIDTGHTQAILKYQGDIIGEVPVFISQPDTSLSLELPDTNPTQSQSSFARGAACGYECWPHSVEDESQYMLGWTASGLIAVGDARDLISALDRGRGGEAIFAAFGLIPLGGETTDALRYINHAQDAASLTERLEFQRTIAKTGHFDGEEFKLVNRLYDGEPGTYLNVNLGVSRDTLKQFIEDGHNIKEIADQSQILKTEYNVREEIVKAFIEEGKITQQPVEKLRLTGIEDASTYSRMTDDSRETQYVLRRTDLSDIEKPGDFGELKASRALAKSEGAKIVGLDDLQHVPDGTFVVHSPDPDISGLSEIDAFVVEKTGDNVEIQRVIEVYSGRNAGKANGKVTQLTNDIPQLEDHAHQIRSNDDISVEVAEDVSSEVYLPPETIQKVPGDKSRTVEEIVEAKDDVTLNTFETE